MCLSFLSARTAYHHRLFTTPSTDVQELLDAIAKNVDTSGRVMVEDGPAALYDEVHLPGIIPALTGVQQIGGPYPHTFLLYYFTTFRWEETFGRPMKGWTPESLRPYLDLYDVRWILTATDPSSNQVGRLSGAFSLPR